MSSVRLIEKILRSHVFSIAIAVNMFSITVFMIALSFFGYGSAAADVGLAHGATLAVFLAFSANARNLILGRESSLHLKQQFAFRGMMILPLVFIAFHLSGGIIETSGLLTAAIIFRRGSEWLAELQICEKEKTDNKGYAYRFIIIQTVGLFLLLFSYMLGIEPFYNFMLFFWACSPAFQIVPFFMRMVPLCMKGVNINFRDFLPHVGSSWIIAVSTLAFRILLALLVAKSIAGILYSAFAIGGMLNAIYTYAVGPSLMSKQGDQKAPSMDRLTIFIVTIHCLVGIAFIVWVSTGMMEESESAFFMKAIGFSVIGGGIMILAQRRRMHILQIQKDSVFVPDVLANILIIATVPFAFYLLGPDILTGLFLWNACLTYAIYTFPSLSRKTLEEQPYRKQISGLLGTLNRSKIQAGVLFFLVFPLFFQLSGNIIFNDPAMLFDSEGILTQLPIPIAVIACFLGIVLLVRFKETQLSGGVLFSLFITMLLSTFVVSMESKIGELGKFILLIQFILPIFALLLGQSYIVPQNRKIGFEAIFLYVLAFIIPLEILATLIQGTEILTPYLYAFSMYQHLQYLPEIFVGLYFLSLITFFEYQDMRMLIVLLAPFIGVYATASFSVLAILMMLVGAGCVLFTLVRRGYARFAMAVVFLLITFLFAYTVAIESNKEADKMFMNKIGLDIEQGAPDNLHKRLQYWKFYWDGILESPRKFMFGHDQAPNRDTIPSAHNYYLDLIYNFGFISLLPFIYLIGHTLSKLYRMIRTTTIPLDLLGLAVLVLFFLLVDNLLKVGFRQPYPGIIMFFLWGVLLSRLSSTTNQNEKLTVTQ